ncbi:MAG TPA: outer membrane beta-barrel protein [Cyclobacteriaceae bacterium]|jgi:hypothetical protein|nr:outer membrane beta-barrel protein [Cyclobacteriaceae bacterium]
MSRAFVVFVCFLIATQAIAQATGQTKSSPSSFTPSTQTSSQFYFGPVLGGSASKVYFFDSQFRYKTLISPGYDIGAMASMRVNKAFRLNAQLLYSVKHKTIVGTDDNRSDPLFRLSSTMQYIELPITYALEFKSVKGTMLVKEVYDWYIGAGPIISYWLSNKGTLRSSNLLEDRIYSYDFVGEFGNDDQNKLNSKETMPDANRFQFGVNFSAGLAFEPAPGRKIMTSLSLNIMQTFLGNSDGKWPGSNPNQTNADDLDILKSKNHSVRFSVAYLFDSKIELRKKGRTNSTIPQKAVRRKRR